LTFVFDFRDAGTSLHIFSDMIVRFAFILLSLIPAISNAQVVCNPMEEQEYALVLGNFDSHIRMRPYIEKLKLHWAYLVESTGLIGCTYELNSENMKLLTSKTSLKKIIFIGTGNGGDLKTADGRDYIRPENLLFQSQLIDDVRFYSCYPRLKGQEWLKAFSNSNGPKLYMPMTKTTEDESFGLILTLLQQLNPGLKLK
jgi:hypothetical protein